MEQKETNMCMWEKCYNKDCTTINIPVVEIKNGATAPVENKVFPVTLCRYHRLIAKSGHAGALQNPDNPEEWALFAPTEMVKIAETVFGAMVYSGQLETMQKIKENTEQMMKQKSEVLASETKEQTDSPADQGNKPEDTDSNK